MISPDANLLLYAYAPADHRNKASRDWLEGILSASETVGFPVLSLHAFVRLVTHPNTPGRSMTLEQATNTVDSWLALPHVRILYPGDAHWGLYQRLASQANLRGSGLTDAAIAAIALEHGGTIHTNDRDFARFPNLPCHYPLQA